MNLEVDDYETLYAHVFKESQAVWHEVTRQTEKVPSELRRVYFYAVGSIDDWDLSLPQSQTALRTSFSRDKDVRDSWLAITGKANPGLSSTALEDKAWAACFNDFKDWYEKKLSILDGMRRFHQGLRIRTDLIDVVERGHWKVNFIHKWVEEKGLDTALAVDMIGAPGHLRRCRDSVRRCGHDPFDRPSQASRKAHWGPRVHEWHATRKQRQNLLIPTQGACGLRHPHLRD